MHITILNRISPAEAETCEQSEWVWTNKFLTIPNIKLLNSKDCGRLTNKRNIITASRDGTLKYGAMCHSLSFEFIRFTFLLQIKIVRKKVFK